MTMLIRAAKKHHTEVRWTLKKNTATASDNIINIPIKYILFTLEIKRGATVIAR
jgi:hypothetical protein